MYRRQDAGKPLRSHGKLGCEYVNPGVLVAQADVRGCIHEYKFIMCVNVYKNILNINVLCV